MTSDNLLSVGKIIGAHGVQGVLKLYPYVESLSLFTSGSRVVLRDSKGNEATYVIKGGSPYKTIYRLALSEITSRNDAENLIESEVLVEKTLLPDLDEDEHYWFEIIGLDVFQTDDAYLGTIDSIIPTGSNDVYVVKHPEKETLIPALQSVVVKIDLPNNRMVVELPEGL